MKDVNELYQDLKNDFPKMSDYELMKLAIEWNRNEIFQNAFCSYGEHPSFLEAIAIQMGYEPKGGRTLLDSIESLSEK